MKSETINENYNEGSELQSPTQSYHKHLQIKEGNKKTHKRYASAQNVDSTFSVQPVPQPHQENKRRHRRTQSSTSVEFTRMMGANPNSFVPEVTPQYVGSKLSRIIEETSPINETPQEKSYIKSNVENQLSSKATSGKKPVEQFKTEIQQINKNQQLIQLQQSQLYQEVKSLEQCKMNEQRVKVIIQEELAELIQNEQFREQIYQIMKIDQNQSKKIMQANSKIESLEKIIQSKDKEINKLKAQLNGQQNKKAKK